MPTTILIAGFGRFPGAPFNPSGPLAQALVRRRRPALADTKRIAHVFPTSYAAVDRDLPKLLSRHSPDIVLIFGLATRARYLRIEREARNAVALYVPDVGGLIPARNTIAANAPRSLRTRAPVTRLVTAAGTISPARLSRDAGRYLCNYAYWQALASAQKKGPLVQFVHIPPLRRAPRPRAEIRHRAPAPADLLRAGEAILIALIAALRR